jgi:esterase/lipase superfamily enzyme
MGSRKRVRILTAALALTAPVLYSASAQTYGEIFAGADYCTANVANDGLPMRSHGAAGAALIAHIPASVCGIIATGQVNLTGAAQYAEVRYSNLTGWVNSSYLKRAEARFGRFKGALVTQFLADGRNIRLVEPFGFVDSDGKHWDVPAGAELNGAFWPGVVSTTHPPFSGKAREAAILLDYYSQQKTRDWQSTIVMTYWALRASGLGEKPAKVIWAVVYGTTRRWGAGLEERARVLESSQSDYLRYVENWVERDNPTLTEIAANAERRRVPVGNSILGTGVSACEKPEICTYVPIFFGTDRKRQDWHGHLAGFGPDRADQLQFGHAIVTVPRGSGRKRGEIPRPNWWERNILFRNDAGEPDKHFTIPENGITAFMTIDDFVHAIRQYIDDNRGERDHALIFIHGYRVTFAAALFRTAQIAYDLGSDGRPFGTAFLYSWPSGGELKDYKYDFDSARFAVDHLKSFINIVTSKTGVTNVHLIAHSMGNWPLMSALNQFSSENNHNVRINQIVLAAPDIDAAEFSKLAKNMSAVAKGVTLYASGNDLAMAASREVHRGTPRAGDVTTIGPLVVEGIDTIDISAVSTDALALGHNHYAEKRELLNDIALLLRQGVRPPHVRTPILDRKQTGGSVYWKYPN